MSFLPSSTFQKKMWFNKRSWNFLERPWLAQLVNPTDIGITEVPDNAALCLFEKVGKHNPHLLDDSGTPTIVLLLFVPSLS